MGLAVAFIMGIYLGALTKALVDDLIMPIVSLATPGVAWENIMIEAKKIRVLEKFNFPGFGGRELRFRRRYGRFRAPSL